MKSFTIEFWFGHALIWSGVTLLLKGASWYDSLWWMCCGFVALTIWAFHQCNEEGS